MADYQAEIAAINARLAEIESRLAEAGRRALFYAREAVQLTADQQARYLEELGRALLFDPETPDDRGDETPR